MEVTVLNALQKHWPEYLAEAWALGTFMVMAVVFTVILEHPSSRISQVIRIRWMRRAVMGLVMGGTAITLIYSPWGQRSGAHMNPAVTLVFLVLGKISRPDAAFYVLAQFLGGLGGVGIAKWMLGNRVSHPTINHAATVPGPQGPSVAFIAELVLSFGMMWMVLTLTNTPGLAEFTGLFAGLLVFLYITLEAPLSGMSINPARTLASALPSRSWTHLWIYFTAPFLGMLLAAGVHIHMMGAPTHACPKMHHSPAQPCIFCEPYRTHS